jgi:HEAT repeat protein
MKCIYGLSMAALLGLAVSASGAGLCLNCGIHCICPPAECPDCSEPCCGGHHHCSCWKAERTQKLIAELGSDCCCDRIKAARHLGYRFNADFCCNPEVLEALNRALLCDSCWEVRKAAAWSIALQGARTEAGVLALYLSSRLDPHYLVRDKAGESLEMLLLCRRPCYAELFRQADVLVAELRKARFKPGGDNCALIMNQSCVACGLTLHGPAAPGTSAATVLPPQAPPASLPPGRMPSIK